MAIVFAGVDEGGDIAMRGKSQRTGFAQEPRAALGIRAHVEDLDGHRLIGLRVAAKVDGPRPAAGNLAHDFEATDLPHRGQSTERTPTEPPPLCRPARR